MKARVHIQGVPVSDRIRMSESRLPLALNSFLDGVIEVAEPITPKKDGPLSQSTSKEVNGRHGSVSWNRVYAGFQEFGQRKDGTHKVKKYTTPGTGARFAETGVLTNLAQIDKHMEKAFV